MRQADQFDNSVEMQAAFISKEHEVSPELAQALIGLSAMLGTLTSCARWHLPEAESEEMMKAVCSAAELILYSLCDLTQIEVAKLDAAFTAVTDMQCEQMKLYSERKTH